MNTPHKHAEVIKAWADGAEIEYQSQPHDVWRATEDPTWFSYAYRVKLERQPNKVTRLLFGPAPCLLRIEVDINDPATPVLVSATWEKS